ncbi:Vigilin [Lucilia cuprina]|nr:Vigilin [Lucilia cuprina]
MEESNGTGTPAHVAEAKKALDKMIEEYEADRADRELRSYNLQIEGDPEYHSKLIGKRGAVINKLRAAHDVNISLPKRGDPNQSIITITGYQANAEAARELLWKLLVLHLAGEERKSTDSEKFGEGESKRICQQISKETGAQIEIASGKNQSLTFLSRAKHRNCSMLRRKILMYFSAPSQPFHQHSQEHHRVILGKAVTSLICGTKEDIEKAEAEIRQLSADQYKSLPDRILVPKIYHPFIVVPTMKTV